MPIDVVKKNIMHKTCLEHVSFTFKIKLSRVAWAQLLEYRMQSHTAQSHRRTKVSQADLHWYIPGSIRRNEKLLNKYKELCYDIYNFYEDMIRAGVPKEDARYILPMSTQITALWTLNLSSLVHFLRERLSPHAQDEIRSLAQAVYSIVVDNILKELKEPLDSLIFDKDKRSVAV